MQFRRLDHTDLEISRVCIGTMTFGSQVSLSEARRMIEFCLDSGVNFIDTANVYNQGLSEEIVGKTLGARRANVILASKVRGVMGDPPEYAGLSREAIRKGIHGTLKRLGCDYLDIYYFHQPDYDIPIEESLEAMEQLRQEGKIRYSGISNYSAWQLCEILWICQKNGYQPPWISQPMYNMVARGIEEEFLAFTCQFGVSNVCYNPLAGGLLSGKQKYETGPLAGTRFDGNTRYLHRYWHEEYFDAVEALREIASEQGLTLVELSVRWLMQQEGVDAVILGASQFDQLQENIRAAHGPLLDSAALAACDEVWQKLRGPTPKYNR